MTNGKFRVKKLIFFQFLEFFFQIQGVKNCELYQKLHKKNKKKNISFNFLSIMKPADLNLNSIHSNLNFDGLNIFTRFELVLECYVFFVFNYF